MPGCTFKQKPGDVAEPCKGKLFVAAVDKENKPFPQNIKLKVSRVENDLTETCNVEAAYQGQYDKANPTVAYCGEVPVGKYTITSADPQLPEEKEVSVEVAVDNPHSRSNPNATITIASPAVLRIVLMDQEDKPLKAKDWQLTAPLEAKGTTGNDGLIEIPNVPARQANGTLTAKLGAPQPPSPVQPPSPLPPATDPPAYPPPINLADFTDSNPDAVAQDAEGQITWTLEIGFLADLKDDPGAIARLKNLGFSTADSADAKQAAAAVRAYQKHYLAQNLGSGNLADIKSDVETRHDKP